MEIVIIGGAGALGSLCRYVLSGAVYKVLGAGFPWGTACVNVLGCLLFGLVWSLAEDRLLLSGQMRLILLTGFMGAFTTFSTFIFEVGEQLRDSQWGLAVANVAFQLVFGLALLFVGLNVGRRWF